MDCNDFQHWLKTRDHHEANHPLGVTLGVEAHMARCPACARMFRADLALEQTISKAFVQEETPRGLADQINLSLKHVGSRSFLHRFGITRKPAFALGGLAAGLILLALVLNQFLTPAAPSFKDLNQISLQAVSDHLKGNQHMTFDAANLDQALAMLTKELGFQVLLPDLNSQDCVLLGGRLCALGNCRAAYFIIEKQGKTGSLFVMDTDFLEFDMADGSQFHTSLKGCDTRVWKDHGQVYAMVF